MSIRNTHERLLDVVLRATKQGSRRSHRAHPHGVLRPPHDGGTFLGTRVATDDGKVQPLGVVCTALPWRNRSKSAHSSLSLKRWPRLA